MSFCNTKQGIPLVVLVYIHEGFEDRVALFQQVDTALSEAGQRWRSIFK